MERLILTDIFTFVAVITAMGCATGIIISWIKWRAGRVKQLPELTRRLDEIAARLGALDNAVEAMAVEVERISEGQRFVAKVLADRAPAAASLPDRTKSSGSTTPQ